ncbi:MAG: DUF459 domain-containing protein [Akkermansia sp.]|nr:DUF459 domain-containing protein [Akkermansia sp.]
MTKFRLFLISVLLLIAPLSAMHLEPGGSGKAAQPIRILLTGDSLMESLGPQMQKAMEGYENISLIPIGKRSTGLSRPDFYNWPEVLEQNLREHHPHIVIMWVGTNDPQGIYGQTGLGEPCSREWLKAYTYKLIEIARLCQKYHARLIFMGPPVMDEEPLDTQLLKITDIMRRTCKHYKLGFVDTRPLLADSQGKYVHRAKMPDGRVADIRWKDRTHITGDGNILIMNKLLPYMGSIIPEARPDGKRLKHTSRPGRTSIRIR